MDGKELRRKCEEEEKLIEEAEKEAKKGEEAVKRWLLWYPSPFNIDLSGSIAQGKSFGSQFTCRIEDFTSRGANSLNGNEGCNSSHFARDGIVESNQFRELVHLSLNIHPRYETVRTYSSSRLNQILGHNAMLKFQLENEKHRAQQLEREEILEFCSISLISHDKSRRRILPSLCKLHLFQECCFTVSTHKPFWYQICFEWLHQSIICIIGLL